jgi:hypothetical protein
MADAGWYRDPTGETQLRYYDGARWTDEVRPFDAPAETEVPHVWFLRWPGFFLMAFVVVFLLGVHFIISMVIAFAWGSAHKNAKKATLHCPQCQPGELDLYRMTAATRANRWNDSVSNSAPTA